MSFQVPTTLCFQTQKLNYMLINALDGDLLCLNAYKEAVGVSICRLMLDLLTYYRPITYFGDKSVHRGKPNLMKPPLNHLVMSLFGKS